MAEFYTWLITGTSRGIGLELTRQLLSDSINIVIATCRNPEKATELQSLKSGAKGVLHIVQLDVADQASIRDSVKVVGSILGGGGLDYLINNAAINEGNDAAFSFDVERLARTIHVNVLGPALIAQVYLPYLERSRRKVIMNMTTGLASIGIKAGDKCATYSISKAALNMLTYKQVAERPDIIAVVIDPGWVKTEMGGEGAFLEPHESVSGILAILTKATKEDSGKFFRYNGEELPW